MEKLKFPNFREPFISPQPLSMDEYAKFCEFYVRNFLDREAYEKERNKEHSAFKVPFRLK